MTKHYYLSVTPTTASTSADYSLSASIQTSLSADLLWRNTATGENLVWQMNGVSLSTFVHLPNVPSGQNWVMQASADFNQDGSADIVWRNYTTGENLVWFMNGTTYSSFVHLLAVTDLNWQIEGTGDFNGDGNSDLVWRNYATGDNLIWFMNGTTYSSFSSLPTVAGASWRIGGIGDFNGDGNADIVWRNHATGENLIWLMNGSNYTSFTMLPNVPAASWEIGGTGDFNGDGQSDILWRNYSTGENLVWLMNGSSYSSFATLTSVGDPNWVPLAPFIQRVPRLLKDLYPGTEGSEPANLVAIGSTSYFTAYDSQRGNELWKSDGTAAGTVLVKDIKIGGSSSPSHLTRVGSLLGSLF